MNLSKNDKLIIGICAGVILLVMAWPYLKPSALGDPQPGAKPISQPAPIEEKVENIGIQAKQQAIANGIIK